MSFSLDLRTLQIHNGGMALQYSCPVSEVKSEILRIEHAIALSCAMNAKFRNNVNLSQSEIDRLKRHIEALEGHVSRVENHAKYLQKLNDSQSAGYEASLSWKVSTPLRWVARVSKRILR
jgi:hypothetical protein